MEPKFNRKTFEYFKGASANSRRKEWYEEHKDLYDENVKTPFLHLLSRIDHQFGKDLPRVKIQGKTITRPLRPGNNNYLKGAVKNFSFVTLWEKQTSRFEWNPGIHIQFGDKPDDNFYGLGLYMVSSRQMHALRKGLYHDYKTIKRIVNRKKFKDVWGEEFGERYQRFPAGYDPDEKESEFLWFKQFYVTKMCKRSEVTRKDFFDQMIADLKVGMPFFQWIRETVGVYRK